MILRRLTKHVNDQNWVAVALDFFIVVAGVFVGLQVQQWAADRDQTRKESIYLERLHGEVLQAADLRAEIVALRHRVIAGLNSADRVLFGPDPAIVLSEAECGAIAIASVMSQLTADLPTLTELLSAGRLDTLSSTETRSILIGYVQQQNRMADALEAITSTVSPLSQRHPALIELRSVENIAKVDQPFIAICDTAKMKKSRSFLNDFVDIRSRYTGYVETIKTASDGLERLHTALDTELGLKHEQGPTP